MLSIFLSPYFFLLAIIFLFIGFFWLVYSLQTRTKAGNRIDGQDLSEWLKELKLLKQDSVKTKIDIEKIDNKLNDTEAKAKSYLQRIGLLRFNPYSDTGGQQSYAVSVLNRNNDGIIISSLFGRSGTRWFVKKVIKGKSTDVDLTEEEQKAIQIAD